jgi:hypothetical protein
MIQKSSLRENRPPVSKALTADNCASSIVVQSLKLMQFLQALVLLDQQAPDRRENGQRLHLSGRVVTCFQGG